MPGKSRNFWSFLTFVPLIMIILSPIISPAITDKSTSLQYISEGKSPKPTLDEDWSFDTRVIPTGKQRSGPQSKPPPSINVKRNDSKQPGLYKTVRRIYTIVNSTMTNRAEKNMEFRRVDSILPSLKGGKKMAANISKFGRRGKIIKYSPVLKPKRNIFDRIDLTVVKPPKKPQNKYDYAGSGYIPY